MVYCFWAFIVWTMDTSYENNATLMVVTKLYAKFANPAEFFQSAWYNHGAVVRSSVVWWKGQYTVNIIFKRVYSECTVSPSLDEYCPLAITPTMHALAAGRLNLITTQWNPHKRGPYCSPLIISTYRWSPHKKVLHGPIHTPKEAYDLTVPVICYWSVRFSNFPLITGSQFFFKNPLRHWFKTTL